VTAVAQKAASGEVFNGSGKTSTTYRQLATAIGDLVQVPALSISFEDAVARCGPVKAGLVSTANRASNRKAVERLRWRPQGPDLLTEVRTGTYIADIIQYLFVVTCESREIDLTTKPHVLCIKQTSIAITVEYCTRGAEGTS